jgi:hypothetical protein
MSRPGCVVRVLHRPAPATDRECVARWRTEAVSDVLKCVKCNGDMVEGAVVYRTSEAVTPEFGRPAQIPVEAEWVSRHPTGSRGGHDTFSVRTFNCPNCGYLESYAP